MKTTIKEIRSIVRDVLVETDTFETVQTFSREEAIRWLANWASGEMMFKDPNGPVKLATQYVDERKGSSFRLLSVPWSKDGVLLATETEVFDPYYAEKTGWVPIESLNDDF